MNWQYKNWKQSSTSSAQRNHGRTFNNQSPNPVTTFKQVKAHSENSQRKAKNKSASHSEMTAEPLCGSGSKNRRKNATRYHSGADMLIPKSYNFYSHIWKT